MAEDSALPSPPFTSEDILRENVSANSARLIPEAIASLPRLTDRSKRRNDSRFFLESSPGKLNNSTRRSLLFPQRSLSVTSSRKHLHAKSAFPFVRAVVFDQRRSIDCQSIYFPLVNRCPRASERVEFLDVYREDNLITQ